MRGGIVLRSSKLTESLSCFQLLSFSSNRLPRNNVSPVCDLTALFYLGVSLVHGNITSISFCFSAREDACKCGYSKTDHVDEAIKPEDFTGESWDRHRHIREVPTDAFGDISFGGLGQKMGKVKPSFPSAIIPTLTCM